MQNRPHTISAYSKIIRGVVIDFTRPIHQKPFHYRLMNITATIPTMQHLKLVVLGAILIITCYGCGGGGGSGDDDYIDSSGGGGGNDPLYSQQWHLKNTGQVGNNGATATPGEDLNVTPVWGSCSDDHCHGEGIVIAVVDDGLQIAHPDLSPNVVAGASYNYLNSSTDPTPQLPSDSHGTEVSGIIAAHDNNNIGVRGIAPRAGLVGFNVLQTDTDVNEADAMTRGKELVSISSNSWGTNDETGNLGGPGNLWKTAIDDGVSNGRNGKGILYFFAGGNGYNGGDNSNYDGYANYHNVMAIAAANAQGRRSSYSELGANILVTGFGGEFCDSLAITTTDLTGNIGSNSGAETDDLTDSDYSQCFNGTSSATPMASGVAALVLQANPNLSWRDVRRILATTARQNDAGDSDWTTNGAGLKINHKYGFGILDADAAVAAATSWVNLPPQKSFSTPQQTVNQVIPDNDTNGVTDSINVSGSGIIDLETVTIEFSAADHTYAGDLEIILTSPAGTQSVLSQKHGCENNNCSHYSGWTFTSLRHMQESADGNWTLWVRDLGNADTGTFQSWRLTFYGN
jgi:proprotein convertase subtilisin/kexin type 2